MFFDQLVFRLSRGNLKEESHYYPFGLPIAGLSSAAPDLKEQRRKYQSNEYIKDLGLNWMDFHARQYDPQIGRFLGVDPLADKEGQEAHSPYVAMDNAPESMIDPDGRDARISIQEDKQGNKIITISSTIYVTGFEADKRTIEYNQFLKINAHLLNNVTKNADGETTTTIILDFKYELANNEDLARLKNDNTRNGDNLIELENSEYQSASGGFRKAIYSKDKNPETGKWDLVGYETFTDFAVRMGNSHEVAGRYYGSPHTAFHEVMHLFGLKDWDKSAKAQNIVGPSDMMNNSSSLTPILHPTHWHSWMTDVQKRQQNQGNKFILNHFVE